MAGARFLDPASIPLKRGEGGNIWATLVTVTQWMTGLVVLAGLALFFVPVIQRTHEYQQEEASLRAQIDQAQEEQQQIRIETEHMKTDPAYVEHVARDQLQVGRPGEEIIRFSPYQSVAPSRKVVHPTPENDSSW
jgi:cell division protein FtsB